MLGETYKEKLNPNAPIGSIELGQYRVVLYERPEGGYFLRPFGISRDDILKKLSELAPNTIATMGIANADTLDVIQTGVVLAPQVNWRPGSGVLDEPSFRILGRDGFSFEHTSVTLGDDEVHDLLARPVEIGAFKKASFFSMNTSRGDLMGIAVRRKHPLMILIAPSIDGSRASSKDGLNTFFSGILTGLTSKLSTFEAEVIGALADASGSDYFDLPYDSSTLNGKLQNALLMQIFTARVFYAARQAQEKGTGVNDKDLLSLFPYLKSGKKTGLAALFASNKRTILAPEIWTNMVVDASKGIELDNPNDKTPTRKNIVPLPNRGAVRTTLQVMSAAEIEAIRQRQHTTQKPADLIPEIKVEKRSQNATEIHDLLANWRNHLGAFTSVRAEKMSIDEFDAGINRLKQARSELELWKRKLPKMRPTSGVTKVDYLMNVEQLSMFGVAKGNRVLDFVEVPGEKTYFESLEVSWSRWSDLTSFSDLSLRYDRDKRLAKSILTSTKLHPIAEALRVAFGMKDIRMLNQGIDLYRLSYQMMCEKTLYILVESGQQISKHGDQAELNNWIHYATAILERMIGIGEEIR